MEQYFKRGLEEVPQRVAPVSNRQGPGGELHNWDSGSENFYLTLKADFRIYSAGRTVDGRGANHHKLDCQGSHIFVVVFLENLRSTEIHAG